MILCLVCKRILPKGSVYCCNSCGGALGKRFCPEGHASHLSAKFCCVCGSAKPSKGATALNLRPLTWVLTMFGLWSLIGLCAAPLANALYVDGVRLVVRAFDAILGLAVWSWILGLLLGENVRKVILAFWMGLARGAGKVVEGLGRFLVGLLKARSSHKKN